MKALARFGMHSNLAFAGVRASVAGRLQVCAFSTRVSWHFLLRNFFCCVAFMFVKALASPMVSLRTGCKQGSQRVSRVYYSDWLPMQHVLPFHKALCWG